ncbi:MAG: hemin uptake protein HemP [Gammaproteobacteria bacterium]
MRGGKEAVIMHGAAEYRLGITSRDKLILTKQLWL